MQMWKGTKSDVRRYGMKNLRVICQSSFESGSENAEIWIPPIETPFLASPSPVAFSRSAPDFEAGESRNKSTFEAQSFELRYRAAWKRRNLRMKAEDVGSKHARVVKAAANVERFPDS